MEKILINNTTEPVITDISANAITAGSFVVGVQYTITTVGTTDFTLIGAASNTIGVSFTATGVGTGTGTATKDAVKISGATWVTGTDMYIVLGYNGTRAEFYFLEI